MADAQAGTLAGTQAVTGSGSGGFGTTVEEMARAGRQVLDVDAEVQADLAALRGQLVLRLTIEPDGSVSMCMLQSSDMDAPELSAQVVDRVRTINFGAKPEVQALTIVYPIDFLPAA